MANRIEVGFKTGIRDALGEKTKKRIIDTLSLNVSNVATIEVYTIDGELSAAELRKPLQGRFLIRSSRNFPSTVRWPEF